MNLMKGFRSFWENCSHGQTMYDSEKNGKSRPIRKICNSKDIFDQQGDN